MELLKRDSPVLRELIPDCPKHKFEAPTSIEGYKREYAHYFYAVKAPTSTSKPKIVFSMQVQSLLVPKKDLPALNSYEGVGSGLYTIEDVVSVDGRKGIMYVGGTIKPEGDLI